MSFGSYLANGFRILAFDKQAVSDIIADERHVRESMFLTAILALVGGLVGALVAGFEQTQLSYQWNPAAGFITGFALGFVLYFVIILIGAGLTHLFAKLFKGQAKITQYYAVWLAMTFALILVSIGANILGTGVSIATTQVLGLLIMFVFAVYAVFVQVFAIRETYALSTGRAVGVVALPAVLVVLLLFFFL